MRPNFKIRKVKMHFIEYDHKGDYIQALCNCGWLGRARRLKVLERKSDDHLEANGGGVKPL